MDQNILFAIKLIHISLKKCIKAALRVSLHNLFFFQLFDHEAEAELTLRNTGKVGFEYSITDPQREDESDEGAGGQRKALEEGELHQNDSEQNTNGLEVRLGQPVVFPPMVRILLRTVSDVGWSFIM